MKWIKRLVYSLFLFVAGWLFNFVFDIQFVIGVVSGWLLREGFQNLANLLFKLL